jgi:hypothetical protein
MLDNLRNQASFQPDDDLNPEEQPLEQKRKPRPPRKSLDRALGMTAPQRFLLSVMLLVIVCLLGAMLLMVTGKIILPF